MKSFSKNKRLSALDLVKLSPNQIQQRVRNTASIKKMASNLNSKESLLALFKDL